MQPWEQNREFMNYELFIPCHGCAWAPFGSDTFCLSTGVRGEMALSDLTSQLKQDVIPTREEAFPWPHNSRFGDLSSLWKKRGTGLAEKIVHKIKQIKSALLKHGGKKPQPSVPSPKGAVWIPKAA